uniref:Cytochrome c oxidase assembly protein COX16 homolog, mitochondrial n=1 Tax=Oncorhynchus kisutch TaxID=8019 RepID=A0A8C7F7Y1_ONCKI
MLTFKALQRNKTLKYGVPMLLLVVGGSFGLREFTQIRYDAQKIMKKDCNTLQLRKDRKRPLLVPKSSGLAAGSHPGGQGEPPETVCYPGGGVPEDEGCKPGGVEEHQRSSSLGRLQRIPRAAALQTGQGSVMEICLGIPLTRGRTVCNRIS